MKPSEGVLPVPGADLYYRRRGAGPPLLLMQGGSGAAEHSDALAAGLSDRWTVLTYDRRGLSRSCLHGPVGAHGVAVHADDARRLLDALAEEPAVVVGASIGALIGLDLLARHPDRVRLLVAHEPPAVGLLGGADRAAAEQLEAAAASAYRVGGLPAAVPHLMAMVGFSAPEGPPPAPQAIRDLAFFLEHDLPAVRRYEPDRDALQGVAERMLPAAGETSTDVYAHRCARALAAALGRPLATFPGGHNGFISHPQECVARLLELLDAH
ncbi:alpha/beta fold hydrolase [Pseudonocardia sp. TRM90224]|uniref:alpha/beta fold hydrolase n=1 Tax=Pseudonocardia sp. TRM90224 TaxID=2812678 RepID=UPI001E5EEBF3|nr:alpha/beta hydrolase [Pseudonocardia sp. TRM90224]